MARTVSVRDSPSPVVTLATLAQRDGCGTNRGWQPLGPGERVRLGGFYQGFGKGCPEAQEFVEGGGDIATLPGRTGVRVSGDRWGSSPDGEMVYSCEVAPPN